MKNIVDEIIQKPERFKSAGLTAESVRSAFAFILARIDENMEIYKDTFPAPAADNGRYTPIDNTDWTASFWTGMLWLAYEVTDAEKYREAAEKQILSFKHRLDNDICMDTHDIGFLYTLSCVAGWKLTGSQVARDTALRAADRLMERYFEKAGIIQAWGNLSDKQSRGRMIIDCLMNLPLLYWASDMTGNPKYREAAYSHAKNAGEYIIREDASTFHTYYMDVETGAPRFGKTQQGYSDTSCWARGQAWGIYGFPLSYGYTGDKDFLVYAKKLTAYFLNRLPEDGICCWDLIFTDSAEDRDSSAAAIAVCGLLENLKYMPLLHPDRKLYENAALRMTESLIDDYLAKNSGQTGLLLHAVYSKPENKNVDESCIWGDYYFFEALVRLTRDWKGYW